MRRRFHAPLFVLLSAVLLVGARPVVAQTVTSDQLAAVALTTGDLQGFSTSTDLSPAPTAGVGSIFLRAFASANGGGSVLIDGLLSPSIPLPQSALVPLIKNGAVLQALASSGLPITQFTLLGPAGVGIADQEASWVQHSDETGGDLQYYGDIFVQGNIIGLIAYGAPAAAANPSVAVGYAQIQAGKLAGLGALPQ